MRVTVRVITAAVLLSQTVSADTTNSKRERAIAQLDACRQSNNVASKVCKKTRASTKLLMELYREGDKSVLPALLRESNLREFYDDSVVSDPEGFLAELAKQPESLQESVARSMAGMFGLPRPQFENVRAALDRVPERSANYSEAQRCLKIVDAQNAAWLRTYFPPHTFSGRAADFTEQWYARDFYALGEYPLWPVTDDQLVYRFTWLRSFHDPVSVTLIAMSDGTGELRLRVADLRGHLATDGRRSVTVEQMSSLAALIESAQFWQMPTEDQRRGLDGAEWILEGTRDRNYHIVTRWCAGETPFGKAAFTLISLSGYKLGNRKIY
jgi:hypothetical protein